MARLDVPTWDDAVVSAQIEALIPRGENTVPWAAIMNMIQTGSTLLQLFSQTAVLYNVLRVQSDGLLLCLLSFASDAMSLFSFSNGMIERGGGMYSGICPRHKLRDLISLGCHHTGRRFRQDGGP